MGDLIHHPSKGVNGFGDNSERNDTANEVTNDRIQPEVRVNGIESRRGVMRAVARFFVEAVEKRVAKSAIGPTQERVITATVNFTFFALRIGSNIRIYHN